MPVASKPAPQAPALFLVLFLGIFLVGGLGLLREGHRAVHGQAYTLTNHEELSWASSLGQGSDGLESNQVEFSGRNAMIFGTGLYALGAMFLFWATGLAISLLGRRHRHVPGLVHKGLTTCSLFALTTASLTLFPVWRIRTLPFYLVLAAFTLVLVLPVPVTVRKKVFPAVVIAVIVAGMVGLPAFPIFAGLIVFLVAGTHVLILWPGLVSTSLRPARAANHR